MPWSRTISPASSSSYWRAASSSPRIQSHSPVRRMSSEMLPIVLISSARRPSRRAVVMISRWTSTASDGLSRAVMLARVVAARMARSDEPDLVGELHAAAEEGSRLPQPALEHRGLGDDPQGLRGDLREPETLRTSQGIARTRNRQVVLGGEHQHLGRRREQPHEPRVVAEVADSRDARLEHLLGLLATTGGAERVALEGDRQRDGARVVAASRRRTAWVRSSLARSARLAREAARPACSSISARSASSTATSSAWRRYVTACICDPSCSARVAADRRASRAWARSASASPPSLDARYAAT